MVGFDLEYDITNNEVSISISSQTYNGIKSTPIPLGASGWELVLQGYYSDNTQFTLKRSGQTDVGLLSDAFTTFYNNEISRLEGFEFAYKRSGPRLRSG